jgi:aspartyl-tRNA(Asn)/glutamyl-tRNA(Gln) amidotransferase subunit A
MINLKELSIKNFREGLINREFSAFNLIKEIFDYIAAEDGEIHAFLSLNRDQALAEAAGLDSRLNEGGELPPLAGVPVAIKDNLLVAGGPCSAGSRILEKYVSSYDATAVRKMKKAGAIIIGKTNLDEFAMGSSTENSAFGPTKNPHGLTLVPGGSSGGSAAAVAAGFSVVALGSDTGGSIRQPAGFCGTVGLKPTYGRVSRFGLIALASSLDQIGPFAKSVEDAETIFETIQGRDEYDATSYDVDRIKSLEYGDLKGITIGLPEEYFDPVVPGASGRGGLDQEVGVAVGKVVEDLKTLGINFKKVNLPHTRYALPCYYIIMPAEASTNLARFDGLRYGSRMPAENLTETYLKDRSLFGEETKRRIILGTFVLSAGYYDAYYKKAQKVRGLIKKDFEDAFSSGVDLILSPTSPTLPFKLGERTGDPASMYLADIFTIPANLAGLPAISIPCRKTGLPIGFQLIARPNRETDLFGVGKFYEKIN